MPSDIWHTEVDLAILSTLPASARAGAFMRRWSCYVSDYRDILLRVGACANLSLLWAAFWGNLTVHLCQVRQGSKILVTSHDQVVAELRPPVPSYRPRRQLGALRGRIRMSEDFDQTPPDALESMERDL